MRFFFIYHFFRRQINMHSDESQNIKCHGCIFTELPPILQRSVKMNIFTWDSEPNYRMLKIALERWQHYYIIFTQRLIDQLTLAIFVASFVNGDHSKMCKSPYIVPDTFLLSTWFIPQTFPFKYNKYQLYTKWPTFWFWPLNMVIIQQYGVALRSTYLWDWTIWRLKNKDAWRKVC